MDAPIAVERRPRDLAAILVALILPSIVTWIYFYAAESLAANAQLAIFNVVKILQFALPVFWVLAVQRGSMTLRPPHLQGVAFGLAFGGLIAAATFALYFALLRSSPNFAGAGDEIRDKLADWRIDSSAKFVFLGLFYSVFHSLFEEYYWRWFVFGQLERWTSIRAAIAISALGFMAHHVLVLGKYFGFDSPLAWLFSASVAVGGAVWAWLYRRTGSLLGPWLSHLLVDAAIFIAGYDIFRRTL